MQTTQITLGGEPHTLTRDVYDRYFIDGEPLLAFIHRASLARRTDILNELAALGVVENPQGAWEDMP